MKHTIKSYFIPIIFLSLLITSCEIEEGEGGKATIKGTVREYLESSVSPGDTLSDYPAPDERVYITYGDNAIYDDDTRTQYDGQYQFEYLKKGTYTIYVYSDCPTCPSKTEPIFRTVKISDKKGVVKVPEIGIWKADD